MSFQAIDIGSGCGYRYEPRFRGPACLGVWLSQLPPKTVSELLANWHAGDEEALRAVVPLVYDELRRIAHHYLRNERPDHTLQSTALVHEAYLRLEKQGAAPFQNREHFLAICAQLMRQILVEYARSRNAAKRDGGYRLTLDDNLAFKTQERGHGRSRRRSERTGETQSAAESHCRVEVFRRAFHRGNFAGAESVAHDGEEILGYRQALAASPAERVSRTMTPERWQQIHDVLEKALELAPGSAPRS